jgi:glycosyltransferase involved in cell wall biosynthesis
MNEKTILGLVSIITPTYNRAELIQETASSIFGQTHRPLQWIVIDDGSTDHTPDVIKEIQERNHNNFGVEIVYRKKANEGVSSARNLGLTLSCGEFVQYLDSDDTLERDKLAIHVDALQRNPEWMLVYGSSFDMEQGAPANPVEWRDSDAFLFDAIRSWTLPTNNPLIRQKVCHLIGAWDESMRCFEDASYFGIFFSLRLPFGYEPAAKSWIRGHHVYRSGQTERVSYRGEPERFNEHARAQASHLISMYHAIAYKHPLNDRFLRAFAQEAFRIIRLHYQVGTNQQTLLLKAIHRSSAVRCRRSRAELASLDVICVLFGKKFGSVAHQKLHTLLFNLSCQLKCVK